MSNMNLDICDDFIIEEKASEEEIQKTDSQFPTDLSRTSMDSVSLTDESERILEPD